ncbi:MAG: 3-oxoadipate enol-lactonase [Pseudomonadota bacterium]
MQFAQVNDVTLHYQIIGAPKDKPAIVFANPLGTDFRVWRDVIVRLVGDFQIVTYDKRGHGLSCVGSDDYSIDLHARDLAGLMDHLNMSQAFICGLSVGGMIAQAVAAQRNDLVKGLLLVATGHKIGPPQMWEDRIQTVLNGGIAPLAPAVLERWVTTEWAQENPSDMLGYQNMVARQPVDGYLGTCGALRDADLTEASSTLPMPVSVIVGDQDEVTPPALAQELAKLVPDGRYDEIKNCRHLPCLEHAPLLSDIIKAFVADVNGG